MPMNELKYCQNCSSYKKDEESYCSHCGVRLIWYLPKELEVIAVLGMSSFSRGKYSIDYYLNDEVFRKFGGYEEEVLDFTWGAPKKIIISKLDIIKELLVHHWCVRYKEISEDYF